MDPELIALLQRARAGDADAMGELARAFRGAAVRMAATLGADGHEAEDAAQEALLLAFTRLDALREPAAFPGWLQALVRTAVHRRARRRRPDLLDAPALDLPDPPDPRTPAPGERLASDEVREAVREAVRGLSPALQVVLERHYLEGRPVAEVAARLGLPEGTVKRRLHDARERLRPRLLGLVPARDDDDDPTPARRPLRLPLR
jgi:RNA polymerase sigma factor (sigma-70 family)